LGNCDPQWLRTVMLSFLLRFIHGQATKQEKHQKYPFFWETVVHAKKRWFTLKNGGSRTNHAKSRANHAPIRPPCDHPS